MEPGCTCTSCLYDEPTYCCDWGCGECCQCSSCCKKDNQVPGAITEAASDASANEQKGAQTQTFALVRKNMAFQMRQKWTMCVVISCPMVFLILIALLGALVFDPMTENALSKWKWSCIQETLKYGEHEMPGINVGHISEKNDAYENDDWPPLYGQESASYEFFVGGAASREDIGWLSAGDATGAKDASSLRYPTSGTPAKERTTKPSKTEILIRRMESSTKLTSPLCTTRICGFLDHGLHLRESIMQHQSVWNDHHPIDERKTEQRDHLGLQEVGTLPAELPSKDRCKPDRVLHECDVQGGTAKPGQRCVRRRPAKQLPLQLGR